MGEEVIISSIVGIVTAIISAWTSYFFTRRKYHAEVKELHIENNDKSLDFYIKLVDDNGLRLEKLLLANAALEEQVLLLKELVILLTELLKKYLNSKDI